jgi:hypothetical protein
LKATFEEVVDEAQVSCGLVLDQLAEDAGPIRNAGRRRVLRNKFGEEPIGLVKQMRVSATTQQEDAKGKNNNALFYTNRCKRSYLIKVLQVLKKLGKIEVG